MYNKLKEFHDAFKNLKLPEAKIESISVNGVNQPAANKNVDIDLSTYAKKTDLNILSTTPATVDGGIWFAFENHQPVLKMYYSGEEYTFQSTTKHEGATTYYISRDNVNLIEDYNAGDIVVLESGLELTDGTFIPRNEYSDLALTFGTDATATIRTTTPAALEYLETQGRVILFVDQAEKRHKVTFYADGRIVEGKAITLASSFADTAFGAGDFTTVKAVRSPISIQGGTVASALIGGSGNDTLVGVSGDDTLTGGAGADLFAVKLTGDNFITDFDAASDKVSLVANDMDNVRGMTVASGGLTLEFDGGSLMLGGSTGGTITVNGAGYIIEDSAIYNGDRTAVTFFDAVTADLASEPYANLSTVKALGGGSIAAGSTGVVMTGKAVSLTGGEGADTFLFTGGDITISGYGTGDKVSLDTGYTLATYDVDAETSQVRLTINDAQGGVAGYITFDGLGNDTEVEFWQTPAGESEAVVSYEKFGQVFIFNNNNHSSATAVTVSSSYGDFGSIVGGGTNGTEYYSSIKKIVATRANTTLIGNKNANTFYFVAGEENKATGGLNGDTYYFTSCGGTITDFGHGVNDATKNTDGKLYATSTDQKATATYYAYDRTDPTSYKEGFDELYVNGTVTAIIFSGHGVSSTTANQTFNADIHFTDVDKAAHVVHLQNIVKNISNGHYITDDAAALKLLIYDLRTGEYVKLTEEQLTELFKKA